MDHNSTERQPWHVLALLFGGLEFCIPVLIVGGILAANFSFGKIFLVLFIGLVVIQWIGNAIVGYMGAKSGLGSSEIATRSMGEMQSKFIFAVIMLIITLGWWAVQTAVATDALCTIIGVDTSNIALYVLITSAVGFLFALPSIGGVTSIKWVDYIAVPAGLLLVFIAIYLSLKNVGIQKIMDWNPDSNMTILGGVNLLLGINVAQWILAPDYTKQAEPKWRDNILIPLGIIGIGFPLFVVGAVMSVSVGEADIVKVMNNLGLSAWGFLVLWLATWTSQMLNSYTGGIALNTITGQTTEQSRKRLTIIFTIMGIALACLGIMDHFMTFMYMLALSVPALAGVTIVHFYFFENHKIASTWNFKATIAIVLAILIGYITQYVYPFGIPAVQSLLVAGGVYYLISEKKVTMPTS